MQVLARGGTTAPKTTGDPELGRRLKIARENRGLSQAEVAKNLNVSFASLSRYESGLQSIAFSDLRRLAKILEVPLEDLLADDPGSIPRRRDPEAITRELLAALEDRTLSPDAIYQGLLRLLREDPEIHTLMLKEMGREPTLDEVIWLIKFALRTRAGSE